MFKKLLLQITILASIIAVSACNVQSPHHTSSGRAAYGNAVPDFKANKKINQKRKKKASKKAKQKKTPNDKSYFHARPY